MNATLKRLGISAEVQAFFHTESRSFDYGGTREVYDEGFHYVPTTTHIWFAGNRYGREVVVTNSAMEAIAWYNCHRSAYNDPAALAFVSLGNLASAEQLSWLRNTFKRQKFILVFGHYLIGALTDIRVAAGLKEMRISLSWQNRKAVVCLNGRMAWLDEDQCSLHQFEQVFGLRTGIRTSKPLAHATFLAQLQHDAERRHPPAAGR